MGSFLSRALLMGLGYAYPAYECFKAVEKTKKTKPEIEQLQFWCQYWILVALFTVGERVGDAFISWLPMYSEAKLAFFIYLWHPKTMGTDYVYNVIFRPYVAKHETEIDGNLLKLKIKAMEIGLLCWEEAAIYVQTRSFEILHYFSSHHPNESSMLVPIVAPKRSNSRSSR
ncbi:HVA22-like protein [Melia azedarach]|uniref:HVA22-like protein n=1 Tax=Melia azedarach TaxID=155640 RepID=A0ACC1XZ25_MELAZ|nr:HVA22-like protein [Melia azedarach]